LFQDKYYLNEKLHTENTHTLYNSVSYCNKTKLIAINYVHTVLSTKLTILS